MSDIPVQFYRTTSSGVNSVPITDGQIVLGTKSSEADLYFDVNNKRLPLSSGGGGGGGSSESHTGYAVCDTAAATATKAVTIEDGDFTVIPGTIVTIKFTSGNSATSPTLSVTDSTGETFSSSIYLSMSGSSVLSSGMWAAGDTISFVYTGTAWVMPDASDHIYSYATTTLSTTGTTTVTVSCPWMTTNSSVSVYASIKNLPLVSVSGTQSCVITLPIWSSNASVSLKVYGK